MIALVKKVWPALRLFLSKGGREVMALVTDYVREAQTNPSLNTGDARREWVISRIKEELGDRYPELKWVINLAIELVVGQIRQALKD